MINKQKTIRFTGLVMASLYLMFTQLAAAAPVDNLPRLTTDSEGHMVCHLCGPEKKDSYFLADYPRGYKVKTASYSKIQDMSRYAILMSDSAPGAAANQTPDFFYIDKAAATPAINSILFDEDLSNLAKARNVYVTEKAGTTLLRVRWDNGERNSFSLDNQAPAYTAQILRSQDNNLFCRNCGGKGQDTLIKGADEADFYTQLIDSPFYALLKQDGGTACPAGTWYAVSKTSDAPEARGIDGIGCDEITDFTPSVEAGSTRLNIRYFNGNRKTLTLQNP
ncbi:TPA: hypothetical protein G9F27_005533 [Salmonella enterica]|uniref:Uncharacterized protein n=1 Tax=Salmonella enterica TaxID=28901 RepID=A0A743SSR3_SALER|nr:hypothetical protein [Salmonella enterica]